MYKRGVVMFGVVSLTMGNSALPFADGGVRDEQALGKFLLGQAQLLAPLADEAAECFLFSMITHSFAWMCLARLWSVWEQKGKKSRQGAHFSSRPLGKSLGHKGFPEGLDAASP